jgi:hypothetical protein
MNATTALNQLKETAARFDDQVEFLTYLTKQGYKEHKEAMGLLGLGYSTHAWNLAHNLA